MDKQKIERAVRDILEAIGENPDRSGLSETPSRVADMCEEIFGGLHRDPREHLKIFDGQKSGNIVIVKDIPVYSVCEHHLLPFVGKASVAYIPTDGKVIGISKLARITDCFARRPQLQERLTNDIADFLEGELSSAGIAVKVEAEHMCMTMRGIRAAGAKTVTCALRGVFETDSDKRCELFRMLDR